MAIEIRIISIANRHPRDALLGQGVDRGNQIVFPVRNSSVN